jgi:hypothetical protein
MSEVIVADSNGVELRAVLFREYDFEIGDKENSFLVTCNRSEWENVPSNARVYIPGTEYGGIYKRLESDTRSNAVAVGGYTWRGMLQNKVLCPPSGQAYATDSGELNQILARRVSEALPGLFVGSDESTGVTVSYRYGRYVTLYDGLKEMLKSAGYRMRIQYDQEQCRVVVDAVPIVDYSAQIEYSSDMNANYSMIINKMGVNHLICLGNGELQNRTVVHLYADANGVISQTQTQFGADEVTDVYDYAGAERETLIESGTDQMIANASKNEFAIDLESAQDVAVGDIVGCRDYITGNTMTAPITVKIVKWQNGFEKVEYQLSEEVTVEQTPVSLMALSAPEETIETETPQDEEDLEDESI